MRETIESLLRHENEFGFDSIDDPSPGSPCRYSELTKSLFGEVQIKILLGHAFLYHAGEDRVHDFGFALEIPIQPHAKLRMPFSGQIGGRENERLCR